MKTEPILQETVSDKIEEEPHEKLPVIAVVSRWKEQEVVIKRRGQELTYTEYSPDHAILQDLRKIDIEVVDYYRLVPALVISVPINRVAMLEDLPFITELELSTPAFPCLDLSVPKIKADQIWTQTNEGDGILVSVVDSGINKNHSDLQGKFVDEQDFSGEGSGDLLGHGTMVAGVIAGMGNVSRLYKGVGSKIRLLDAKAFGKQSSLRDKWKATKAIEWSAIDKQADVINISAIWHPCRPPKYCTLCRTVDAVVLQHQAVVVAAAGNKDRRRVRYWDKVGDPGGAAEAITVGASTDSDTIWSKSVAGPTFHKRNKPDLVAPGQDIMTTSASSNNSYHSGDGTSFSCAHVSGVSALLLKKRQNILPSEIRRALQVACVKLTDPTTGQHYSRNLQGDGRVDAEIAYGSL